MVRFDPLRSLPTSAELPSSDDTPVDNELQNLVPNFLEVILGFIWLNRNDWFFAVDMGIYHTTGSNPRIPIVPDGFLSLGVERLKNDQLRESYVVWEENNVVPIWVLEVVSKTYGGEYNQKLRDYAQLGVLYYTVYNPIYWRRDKHEPLEVYRLVDGVYELQPLLTSRTQGGELGGFVWMPELGLGIGRGIGSYCGLQREWLCWYDQEGKRFPTPEEVAQQEREIAQQEREIAQQEREIAQQERGRAQKLAAKLRELGIDPDEL
jgi:Uma2 family endonuclease